MEPPVLYDASKHSHLIPSMVVCHASCITTEPFMLANFLPPLKNDLMTEWWKRRCDETSNTDILSGERYIILQLAPDPTTGEEEVAGVVMLAAPYNETGVFRGNVEKLLVCPHHRRKGIAGAIMTKLEEVAKEKNKLLLLLATEVESPAATIYPKFGYIPYGIIPQLELSPKDREPRDAVCFYKDMRPKK